MSELAGNKELLKQVLTYHVVPAKATAAQVKPGNTKAVNGANVALAKTANFVTVEEALVTGADETGPTAWSMCSIACYFLQEK